MIVDVEKQRLTNLESKLREKDSYIEELSIKNTRLMRDIEDFSIKNTRLVREIEDFSIKMRSSSEETSKIAEMYNKIEVLEGKNYRLQETCNNYQEKLTAKEIQLKNFEYEKVKNDRFDDEKFRRLEEAEREINRLVKDRSNLMAENEDLRFQAENQEKQIITSKSIILDQQREVSRLSSLRGSKESEISHLQEEIDRMTAQNKEDCQRLEDEIRRLVKKNRDLEADFSEVVKKAPENNDKKNEFTIFKLKSEVESLRNENENVIMELNSRPTVKQHKECLRKLEELEVNVSQSRGRSKNRSQSTTPHRLGTHNTRESIRKDREMHSLTAGQLPSSKTLQLIIIDIMEYLKLENASEILPNIRKLEENRENTKFIRRMAQLIKECSPPGAFHTDPSTKVI